MDNWDREVLHARCVFFAEAVKKTARSVDHLAMALLDPRYEAERFEALHLGNVPDSREGFHRHHPGPF